jgi:long-chain acyl-CoA synthetase
VVVPIYPTLTAHQAEYILNDAGARVAFASDRAQMEKIQQVRHRVPTLRAVVLMAGDASGAGGSVLGLEDVARRGRPGPDDGAGAERRHQARVAGVQPGALATIIYTSGTTGEPKGAMLTHANIVSNVVASLEALDVRPDDTALSFLPLSHVFERMVVYLYLVAGATVYFAESIETVARDLKLVRPTVMTGVPRLFEKMHARVREEGARGSALRRALFTWAVSAGERRSRAVLEGRRLPALSALRHRCADRLVLSRIRAALGGRMRYMVSGSAALPKAVGEFFHAVGLNIIEGYGLTETAPVLTVNPPTAPRFGTVGKTIRGVELRIAEDGEILARGPNVMIGYYNKPAETAAALEGGWFHTGDVGEIDADGYLRITDRKKDILITSGGKKIVPQPIESMLKASPLVGEAVLIGEKRRFPSALLVPDFAALERRLTELGRALAPREELVARPDVIALYDELIDAVNLGLAHFEQVKRFAVLPQEFSIERGELTPTMKVRRRAVEERWKKVIEDMYVEK